MCSYCKAYGLKKHGLTRSDYTSETSHSFIVMYKLMSVKIFD